MENCAPDGWEVQSLGEIFKFRGGGTPDKKNPEYWNGQIPWASVKDIKSKYLEKTIDHISEKGLRESAANLATVGDLVLLTRIEPGKTAIVKRDVAVNQDCKIAKPLGCVDVYWGYYLFQNLEREFIKRSSGTTVLGIRLNDVHGIEVSLPPLNEQKRIVAKIEELFSELDNGIAALKTAREQLKVYRQAVLKHAFEGKLTATWREENADKLETPEQLLARIQLEREARYQQQLAEWKVAVKEWEAQRKEGKKPGKPKALEIFPAVPTGEKPFSLSHGWTWVHLGELITGIDQGWSPKCENTSAGMDSWGVIRTTAVQHGEFLEDENKALPDNLEPRDQHELAAGDILITRAGPRVRVGVCCLVKKVRAKLMNCDKVYRIRCLENVCRPEYLEAVLNSPVILDVLEGVKSGINDSGVNLNQSAFLKMLIPFCNLHEQRELISKIEETLSVISKQQEVLEIALKQSETLRQSILKKAFSGHLVPQDPTDEPASALLARIKAEKAAAQAQAKPTVKKTVSRRGRKKKGEVE